MTRYQLPDTADLIRLGEPHAHAITVYAQTSPAPDQRENNFLTAKSAVDRALRGIRDRGTRHAVEQQLRDRWTEIAESDLWLRLSRSLAIFIADDFHEVFVLPNRLENQSQMGAYFDIGQLVRAVMTPQEAYALTLSANGWNLWRATAAARAEEMPLVGEYATDVAEATNRATVRDRDHVGRLVGDEGKKVLLETYAKRVADAVNSELGHVDPSATRPLFVFAADPSAGDVPRPGPQAPDGRGARRVRYAAARPDRRCHPRVTVDHQRHAHQHASSTTSVTAWPAAWWPPTSPTSARRRSRERSRRWCTTSPSTSWEGSTPPTVASPIDDSGYDLLSRIAITVLDKGGEVIAVRPEEVNATIWNGTAVAGLRFALT